MPKATPRISVIERRLQAPSVFRTSSQPVPLKEPTKWKVRWENAAIRPDHLWDIIHNKGWAYCEPADLDCPVEEIGAQERDGRIVRGERGQEVLVKMLLRDYQRVEQLKTDETIKQTFGKTQLKQAIVNGVVQEHGDRAAEFIHRQVHTVSVEDQRGPADED